MSDANTNHNADRVRAVLLVLFITAFSFLVREYRFGDHDERFQLPGILARTEAPQLLTNDPVASGDNQERRGVFVDAVVRLDPVIDYGVQYYLIAWISRLLLAAGLFWLGWRLTGQAVAGAVAALLGLLPELLNGASQMQFISQRPHPRYLAVGLVVLAVGVWLRKSQPRLWLLGLLAGLALTIHPITPLALIAMLPAWLLLHRDPQWPMRQRLIQAAAGVACFALVTAPLWFKLFFATHAAGASAGGFWNADPQWRQWIGERFPFLIASHWRAEDWLNLVKTGPAILASLWLIRDLFRSGQRDAAAKLGWLLAAGGVVGLGGVLAADLLPAPLLLQIQLHRATYLINLLFILAGGWAMHQAVVRRTTQAWTQAAVLLVLIGSDSGRLLLDNSHSVALLCLQPLAWAAAGSLFLLNRNEPAPPPPEAPPASASPQRDKLPRMRWAILPGMLPGVLPGAGVIVLLLASAAALLSGSHTPVKYVLKDGLILIAAGVGFAGCLLLLYAPGSVRSRKRLAMQAAAVLAVVCVSVAMTFAAKPSGQTPASRWARASTPAASVFVFDEELTGRSGSPEIFRINAGRAVYFAWVDACHGIFSHDMADTWLRRRNLTRALAAARDRDQLLALLHEAHATYFVSRRVLPLPLAFEADGVRVYEVLSPYEAE